MHSGRTVPNNSDSGPTEVEHTHIADYLKKEFIGYITNLDDVEFRREGNASSKNEIKDFLQVICGSYAKDWKSACKWDPGRLANRAHLDHSISRTVAASRG